MRFIALKNVIYLATAVLISGFVSQSFAAEVGVRVIKHVVSVDPKTGKDVSSFVQLGTVDQLLFQKKNILTLILKECTPIYEMDCGQQIYFSSEREAVSFKTKLERFQGDLVSEYWGEYVGCAIGTHRCRIVGPGGVNFAELHSGYQDSAIPLNLIKVKDLND